MKKRSKNKVVKALIILTLVGALFYCTLIMPKRIKEASYRLYSYNEIQKLEVSENPLFYERRTEKSLSEKWTYEIFVFAMLDNGTIKDLFSVSANSAGRGIFKVYEDENNVYLCRDGAVLVDFDVVVLDEEAVFFRDDAAPFIIQYEKKTGKVSDIGLKGDKNKIVLDLFSYKDNLNYLIEKRTKKPFFKMFSFFPPSTWIDSVGFLGGRNPKEFDFKVVGDSLLNVSGCLAGDYYYFPAISGIYKINLKTSETDLCIEKDYRKYNYVQIIKRGDSFIVVEEKIISYTGRSLIANDRTNEKETEVNILEYASDFKQEKRKKEIDICIDYTVIGTDGIILYDKESENITTVKSVYCRFFDFSVDKIPEYKDREEKPMRWHFIDDMNEFWLVRIGEGEDMCKTVLSYKE